MTERAHPLTEGERWTAEALTGLRAGRYRPSAWARFAGVSLARAAQTRRARPALAAQTRRWAALGAAAWLGACRLAAGRRGIRLPRRAGLAWWLAVCQMLDWHLGMAESDDGERRERLSAADAATMSRLWLVPAVIGLRGSRHGLGVAIAAGALTDWLDGTLARRRGPTRLGRDLDTTADLAFFATAASAAAHDGRLPRVAAHALHARYAAGFAFAVVSTFGRAHRRMLPVHPAGAALRVGGLLLALAGARRTGAALLMAGCTAPPHTLERRAPAWRRGPRAAVRPPVR